MELISIFIDARHNVGASAEKGGAPMLEADGVEQEAGTMPARPAEPQGVMGEADKLQSTAVRRRRVRKRKRVRAATSSGRLRAEGWRLARDCQNGKQCVHEAGMSQPSNRPVSPPPGITEPPVTTETLAIQNLDVLKVEQQNRVRRRWLGLTYRLKAGKSAWYRIRDTAAVAVQQAWGGLPSWEKTILPAASAEQISLSEAQPAARWQAILQRVQARGTRSRLWRNSRQALTMRAWSEHRAYSARKHLQTWHDGIVAQASDIMQGVMSTMTAMQERDTARSSQAVTEAVEDRCEKQAKHVRRRRRRVRATQVWCKGELIMSKEPGGGVQALQEVDRREANAAALTSVLHEQAGQMPPSFWGGDSARGQEDPDTWPRGTDARPFSYPWVRPRHDPGSTSVISNDHIPESNRFIREQANDPVLAKHPHMDPVPVGEGPVWPADKPLPTPEQLARRPEEIKLIRLWCKQYAAEMKRSLKPKKGKHRRRPHRFRYNVLPGGRTGLILKDFLKEEYMGFVWDCRDWIESGGKKPCKPMEPYAAQKHSEWNLEEIMRVAKEMNYSDMDILQDLCVNGFRSHSTQVGSNVVMLAPNYPGFWKHPEFAAEKVQEETAGFIKPRMTEGFPFPPYLVCRCHPRGIAEQISAETGAVKLRITIDPGYPRAPHGQKWQPGESIAWNDGVDLNDPLTHPGVQYGSVHEYAKSVALLKTAGVPIGQTKTDVRGYFRGMTVRWNEVAYGLQWVDKAGIRADYVLAFGQSPNPQISQRISVFIEACIMVELDKLQQTWHCDDLIPPEFKEKILAWEKDRKLQRATARTQERANWLAQGKSEASWDTESAKLDREQGPPARWAVGQVFVDDFMHATWSFWIHEVARVTAKVCADFNIELADGRWDPLANGGKGANTKNKTETVTEDAPMEILGCVVDPAGRGEKRLTAARATKYAELGEQLSGRKTVSKALLQSWLGRVVFAASAIVGLRTAYLSIFAALKQGWSEKGQVALSSRAWAAIDFAVILLRKNEGSVLWPMRREPGAEGRPVVWTWTDAALAPDAPRDQFVGYGIIIYIEGTDTVYVLNGQWTSREQAHLCITTLELAAEEFALDKVRALMREVDMPSNVDIIQVADNKGAREVANGMSATSPALRTMLHLRMRRRHLMPDARVVATWAHREAMEHADAASKDDTPRLMENLLATFGDEIRVVFMEPVAAEVRNLDAAVLAACRGMVPSRR